MAVLRYPHPQDNLPPLEVDVDPDSIYGVTPTAHDRAIALADQLIANGWARIDTRDAHHYPNTQLADTDVTTEQVLTEVWAAAWRVELRRAITPSQRDEPWVRRMFKRGPHDPEWVACARALVRVVPYLDDLGVDHPRQVTAYAERTTMLLESLLDRERSHRRGGKVIR